MSNLNQRLIEFAQAVSDKVLNALTKIKQIENKMPKQDEISQATALQISTYDQEIKQHIADAILACKQDILGSVSEDMNSLEEIVTRINQMNSAINELGNNQSSDSSAFKQVEIKRVSRANLQVVSGTGNARVWRVPFDNAFDEIPMVLCTYYNQDRSIQIWSEFNVTTTHFDISTNYAGRDIEIGYIAFTKKSG
ncbi:H-type lectin domain-containing protein [Pasteurella multocida]|uniref:H-type lectin domain-containing protein n=1 Tax=Pasteurella multocida TaxID=747 RepID=UPI001EE1764F|nr:H-type lectin domain-containing protein [Pasteurella multocida]MDX3890448.1 H-type lectin domain-containing protein [Pasteurella multocida]MDX3892918.1 H-type lectin domain-containing protein [Pasteurella multocida]MDX3898806.1 H-type lectin domain-containing protein [Pasteurella multocida]MDX3954291.1 H-type lectin domain-containing protein [Pasteurella multocida]MDX3956445.1 H-type lectin domain-containing protein [Pasteurella multocida]